MFSKRNQKKGKGKEKESGTLITNEYLAALYRDVHFYPNKERPSNSFWNYLLSKEVFKDKIYVVDEEFPPNPDNEDLRMDNFVRQFEKGTFRPVALMVGEGKNPGKATAEEAHIAENQGRVYASECCKQYNISFMYVMTYLGTAARLWKYHESSPETLEPLFGGDDYANPLAYVDADSDQARVITKGFKDIKKFPPTLREGQSYRQLGQTFPAPSPAATVSGYASSSAVQPETPTPTTYWQYDDDTKTYDYVQGEDVTYSNETPPSGVWIRSLKDEGWRRDASNNVLDWALYDGTNWRYHTNFPGF